MPAAFVLLLMFPIIILCLRTIPEPCRQVSLFFISEDACTYDAETDQVYLLEAIYRKWFVFVPWGSLVITLVILFWHPVCSFWSKDTRIFLDKLKYTELKDTLHISSNTVLNFASCFESSTIFFHFNLSMHLLN